jgi:hypothetical protein
VLCSFALICSVFIAIKSRRFDVRNVVFFILTTVKLLTQERTSPLIFSNLSEALAY